MVSSVVFLKKACFINNKNIPFFVTELSSTQHLHILGHKMGLQWLWGFLFSKNYLCF